MATALVTGASSGIGRAIAVLLAEAGWKVLAIGRDPDRLQELRRIPGIEPVGLDITERDELLAVASGARIELLANNAGMMPPPGPFQTADQSGLDTAIAVNLTAQIALTRMVLPGMVARGKGHIFFTGSIAGHAAFPDMAVYCATKAGLSGFAQALRLDVAQHGVRVTEIVAGRIETGIYREILPDDARATMYAGQTAVQPEDVARMVLAIHALPERADVARFDILPTRKPSPENQTDARAK
ncbi:SDR family oxidoreductase [Paracoccus sp. R12_1]|uniref:SDR family oxidoreductase n=1 Tax=unclassified Paracoccus (in: a-proteobacteria) TaxID=2688777 RepID=UPI001ADD4A38|nr:MULTISPECIES: SDR family oxidoreductase [unclassified Paracoccus (in: a-proteobacteria)]MBO9456991.1 SDR family oxidoreductase [Paracoccus sp. R12_2]MBO9488124.1 SDR family oxidoreductase [Paracoccus sp. R12_1]